MGQTANYCFDGSGAAPSAEARVVQATYDFSKVGGGTATYNLIKLNRGCRILGGWVDCSGTVTAASGTPTIALTSGEGAGDLLAATSVLGAPFSNATRATVIPTINTPQTNSLTLTADRNVAAVIASAAITTGVFTVFLEVVG